jgi:hypothetical protein
MLDPSCPKIYPSCFYRKDLESRRKCCYDKAGKEDDAGCYHINTVQPFASAQGASYDCTLGGVWKGTVNIFAGNNIKSKEAEKVAAKMCAFFVKACEDPSKQKCDAVLSRKANTKIFATPTGMGLIKCYGPAKKNGIRDFVGTAVGPYNMDNKQTLESACEKTYSACKNKSCAAYDASKPIR